MKRPKKLTFTPIPLFLQWEVSYNCQLRCPFCYNPVRDEAVDKTTVWKIAKAIKAAKIPHVQLTGGEVTLVPYLGELIAYLSRSSGVSIVTNAIKKVRLPTSLLCMYVSLHGSNKKIHESLTNVPNTYKIICENIRRYVKEGIDVSADVLLTSKNYFDMYKIIEKASTLGMKRVFINRFQPGGIGRQATESLMPTIQQFKCAITQMLKARKEFKIEVILGTAVPFCVDIRLVKEGLAISCGAGTWSAAIDPYGNFRICNQSDQYLGNVTTEKIEDIWNKNLYLNKYRDLGWIEEPCKSCQIVEFCAGGCRIDGGCSYDKLAHVDYYVASDGSKFRPNLNRLTKMRSVLLNYPKKIKIEHANKVQQHLRIINRERDIYLVNPDAGIVRINKYIEKQIKNILSGQRCSLPKKILAQLGILVRR